jgi:hypothetical protein
VLALEKALGMTTGQEATIEYVERVIVQLEPPRSTSER